MSDYSVLDERIRNLENLYAGLKANVELLDPKTAIEFQAETIGALRAIEKEIVDLEEKFKKYVKDMQIKSNRLFKRHMSIVMVAIAVASLVMAYFK